MFIKTIRVFPRRTNATPIDDLVRIGGPDMFDECDNALISVTWTSDIPKSEKLYKEWSTICDTKLGGPAFNDPGGEFTPGLFIKYGYVFTSRGCPNNCWFCVVPKREGVIRELKINDGWNILDSNLLACSDEHIRQVIAMLKRQKERPRFSGGLEAKRLTPWFCDELKILKPSTAFFAYDTSDDWEPLVAASMLLRERHILPSKNYRAFVLIGWRNDTIEKAEERLIKTMKLGFMPMAMLYNNGIEQSDVKKWKRFQREWASPIIVGYKMSNMEACYGSKLDKDYYKHL